MWYTCKFFSLLLVGSSYQTYGSSQSQHDPIWHTIDTVSCQNSMIVFHSSSYTTSIIISIVRITSFRLRLKPQVGPNPLTFPLLLDISKYCYISLTKIRVKLRVVLNSVRIRPRLTETTNVLLEFRLINKNKKVNKTENRLKAKQNKIKYVFGFQCEILRHGRGNPLN